MTDLVEMQTKHIIVRGKVDLITVVENNEGTVFHLARGEEPRSLCGLLSFYPPDKYRYSDLSMVTCEKCRKAQAIMRTEELDPDNQILHLTVGFTGTSRSKHYTYNGEVAVCGSQVRTVKLMPATESNKATCLRCLASPAVEKKFKDPIAEQTMAGRGKYDREAYGLKNLEY